MIEPTVEALIKATGIDFRIGGNRAFYMPGHDYVQVPAPQAYFEPINWHRTALHELGHASGAPHRLNRDLSGSFGSKKYAFEELVAEMNAAFCCASLGIVPTVRHADYIASWLEVLREDNRAIVRAASQASKAADFLLGFLRMMSANPPMSTSRLRDALPSLTISRRPGTPLPPVLLQLPSRSLTSRNHPGCVSMHHSQRRLPDLRFGFCRAGRGIDALSWHHSSLVRGPRTRPSRAAICRGRSRSGNGVRQLFSAAGPERPALHREAK